MKGLKELFTMLVLLGLVFLFLHAILPAGWLGVVK